MECRALTDSSSLAHLIADLEDTSSTPWRQAAVVCHSQSVEDPGRRRLWIIPRDEKAGANPRLWITQHRELMDELVHQTVAHTTIVFPGALPKSAERHFIDVASREDAGQRQATRARGRRSVRRDVRAVSAPSHLWVDRLRTFDHSGSIDEKTRSERLRKWGRRYWTKEMEGVYIPPNLRVVHDSSADIGEAATKNLLATRPSCPERGLVVIYGQGGVGKTFFLSRVADRLAVAASGDPTACVPVMILLAGVLHRYALENWLSRNGFGMLTLGQITCLLRHGVIVPLLDALDEVVKGEARQGSEEFLDHMLELTTGEEAGRGILACRDYYLTTDRALVRERVRESRCAELSIGPFDKQDTRRFIEASTGLSPDHASRWAEALERQAMAIVQEDEELDVIRHPVVLDTLARYIRDLPPESRVTAADEFRLSRGDIFGDIVDELLRRERQKHAPLWEETFAGWLEPEWMHPFEPEKQREVLRELTLLTARDGGSRQSDDEGGREFRHGLFLGAKEMPQADNPRDALEATLCQLLGQPKVALTVPDDEQADVQAKAVRHMTEAYAGHILANTEPSRPDDLVFALRHRFYFDYFLADALLAEIERAIATGRGHELVEWCLEHHVGDTFAGCLDFLAWDPRIARVGGERLRDFFRSGEEVDELLASYLTSLALAVFLRRQIPGREGAMEQGQFSPDPKLELLLMKEFLPTELSHFCLLSCSFPRVTIDSIDLADVTVESCDFQELRVIGRPKARITGCKLVETECRLLALEGNLVFSDTELDIEGDIVLADGARIELYNCAMTERVLRAFEQAKQTDAEAIIKAPRRLEKVVPSKVTQSVGRRFVNRLMALLRKEGHSEFGVYIYKLRDKTPGSDEQFSRAVDILTERGCVETEGPMVFMTSEGATKMYQPKLLGNPDYDPQDQYWEPIIQELDGILTS